MRWARRRARLREPFVVSYVEDVVEFPPPNAGQQRYAPSKSIGIGESTVHLRVRLKVGLEIGSIDVRCVTKRGHVRRWFWKRHEWNNVSQEIIAIENVIDGDIRRTPLVLCRQAAAIDDRAGGRRLLYEPIRQLLAKDSIWLEVKVRAHAPWVGYLEVQGCNEEHDRAYFRIPLTVNTSREE